MQSADIIHGGKLLNHYIKMVGIIVFCQKALGQESISLAPF